ncbi:Undecaprenyl-diphosphatase [bacterium HR36]|nr:Undecaprenyl-diphosphatase [bacterium HR36]
MDWWQAILLGVLQGLTEFLPVSSSGHLVLGQQFFRLTREESGAALFFDGMVHLGTTLAVICYFWRERSKRPPVKNGKQADSAYSDQSAAWSEPSANVQKACVCAAEHTDAGLSWGWWLWLLGWASLPAALAVLLLNRAIRDSFVNVPLVASNFLILGGLLWATDCLSPGTTGAREMCWYHALLIGVGQAFSAVLRGLSRSGMTLSVALLLGLERTWAVRFSFAMSIVANLGLALLGAVHAWWERPSAHWFSTAFLGWTLLAALTSALVGYATMRPLLQLVRQARLRWFSYYLWAMGLVAWIGYAWRSA